MSRTATPEAPPIDSLQDDFERKAEAAGGAVDLRLAVAGTPVRIRTTQRNGSALLSVEDEGPGIPAEHSAQVFERFYRLDSSIASGSGLGLAIARELAELMGGSVELESRTGRTTFALVLPTELFSHENEEPPLQ